MKKILCWLILVLVSFYSLGQDNPTYSKIDSLINTSEFGNALLLIDRELGNIKVDEQIIWLKSKKAEVLISQGNLTDAETLLNSINSLEKSPKLQGIVSTNIGYLYLNKGRNDLALQNLEEAQAKFQ
ncbi:MAG: tetratricopeptide repeat protein, partial [Bacteroidia bacterium]|nr:tetratricopeptide repeat protein [Bacteroidia bacterium]